MRRLAAALLACLPLAAAALEDVPFVVTPDNVTTAMLQLAGVGPEDYLIDLGSGDGRIVIVAAKRFGARGLGVEIDPKLVEESRRNARAAGVSARALFREQDLFKTDLSPASVITMYLLPDVNLQLRPKLLALRPGTRVVSHDWDMGEWQPDKSLRVDVPDKAVGLEKTSRVHLWIVPARVQGLWCGTGKAKGAELQLAQQFQRFRGEIARGDEKQGFEGRIEGATLRSPRSLNLRLEGDRLRAQAIAKDYSPVHGGTFVRARGDRCPPR
ncbi:MAG TPA: class I SAM-dependent methyltransferase [Usitatibacter sp.]|nr:class I SAM-dependent methyltransferase [Usitatibacter sp.]